MEMALEFGTPYESLARSMTERELRAWGRYSRRKLLPTRRLELYLAQIACTVARGAGAKNTKIEDYIIELAPEGGEEDGVERAQVDVQAVRNAMDFRPRFKRTKEE